MSAQGLREHAPKPPQQSSEGYSQPNTTDHLTLEIVFGETRYDLARKRLREFDEYCQ
jgi:hypothetical protein